jgi:hypothetical protein
MAAGFTTTMGIETKGPPAFAIVLVPGVMGETFAFFFFGAVEGGSIVAAQIIILFDRLDGTLSCMSSMAQTSFLATISTSTYFTLSLSLSQIQFELLINDVFKRVHIVIICHLAKLFVPLLGHVGVNGCRLLLQIFPLIYSSSCHFHLIVGGGSRKVCIFEKLFVGSNHSNKNSKFCWKKIEKLGQEL